MKDNYYYHSYSIEQLDLAWAKEKNIVDLNSLIGIADSTLAAIVGKNGKTYVNLPRVCVLAKQDDSSVRFTIARCSEKDSYSKKKARELCEKRFSDGKYYKSIPSTEVPQDKTTEWFIKEAEEIVKEVIVDPRKV